LICINIFYRLENSIVDTRFLLNGNYNNKNELNGHSSCVLSLKYAKSGDWFVTTGKDHQWIIWKGPSGNIIHRVRGMEFNIFII